MSEGKFITFEGIEGCGKTLQLSLLCEELRFHRLDWIMTREPGGTAFGAELRQILLGSTSAERQPVSELLLYLADRYQHLHEVIEPALARGALVFCDRYHDATRAYQGHARGLGFELIDDLAGVLGIRRPDLTIVLDLDVAVALERARGRNAKTGDHSLGRFESEELAFHEKVREGYRLIASREPRRMEWVDARGTPEEVFSRIHGVLTARGVMP